MSTSISASDHTWLNGSSNCDAQLCTRETCQRRQKFKQFLQWLAAASKASDYASQIIAVVNTICAVPVSTMRASLLILNNTGILSVPSADGPSRTDPAHRI